MDHQWKRTVNKIIWKNFNAIHKKSEIEKMIFLILIVICLKLLGFPNKNFM